MPATPAGGGAHLRAVAVVGNPRPASRTATVALLAARQLAEANGAAADAVELLDLADLVPQLGAPLGAGSGERWSDPLATLHAADVLVVATPVYKGSYSGLLKAFLDHVAADALAGTLAVPLTTLGGPAHALAADVHLRPLLLELGAATPTTALVVTEADLADPAAAVDAWAARNRSALVRTADPGDRTADHCDRSGATAAAAPGDRRERVDA